ncbi:MAG: flavodoxin family protein [Acidimicrobiales bacterium]
MRAVVIYESLTGNTRKASGLIAAELRKAGHECVACPIDDVDYQALHEADLVVVGGWTDGLFFFGQRPGRAWRLRGLPALAGKRAVCFVTYALDSGKTLQKLIDIVESRGATVEGGMTIRRDKLEAGARNFAARVLDNVAAL